MADGVAPGRRAVSDAFGQGTVVTVTGGRALVKFDRYPLKLSVPTHSLALVGQQQPSVSGDRDRGTARALPMTMPAPPPPGFNARRAVDALRFGVVPAGAVAEVTLRFDAWRKWIERRLPYEAEGQPTMTEITGAFGSGKSHTMAVVRHVARQVGYLTARVEVDGTYLTFSKPEQLLAELLRTLKGPDGESATLLLDLHLRAVEGDRSATVRRMQPFRQISTNLGVIAELRDAACLDDHTEDLQALISGEDSKTATQLGKEINRSLWRTGRYGVTVRPCRVVPYRLDERAQGFADALMGYAALAKLAGYRGLVVAFDEFEVLPAFLSQAEWARLVEVLSEFGRRLQRGATASGPLGVFIATIAGSDGRGDQIVTRLRESTKGELKELDAPTNADVVELGRMIASLYAKAYGVDASQAQKVASGVALPESAAVAALGGKLRAHVRLLVYDLDSRFGPPAH